MCTFALSHRLVALGAALALVVAGLPARTARADAAGAAPVTVVVNNLKPIDVTAGEALQISDIVRSAAVQTGRYTIVSRDQMEAIAKEGQFQKSDLCDDTKCQAEIGGALGAQKMIVGTVGKLGRAYTLSLRLLDITTLVEEASVSEQCLCELHELAPVGDRAIRKLFGLPPQAAAAAQAAPAAAVTPASAPEPERGEASGDDGGGVTSRWWFWALVVAVVGGGATAVALSQGGGDDGRTLTIGAAVPPANGGAQ